MVNERARQEAYVRGVEDCAHQEINRARQETKHWQQQLETADRANKDPVAALEAQRDGLFEQLRKTEKELAVSAGQVAGLEKALSKTQASKSSRSRTGRAKSATAAAVNPSSKKESRGIQT